MLWLAYLEGVHFDQHGQRVERGYTKAYQSIAQHIFFISDGFDYGAVDTQGHVFPVADKGIAVCLLALLDQVRTAISNIVVAPIGNDKSHDGIQAIILNVDLVPTFVTVTTNQRDRVAVFAAVVSLQIQTDIGILERVVCDVDLLICLGDIEDKETILGDGGQAVVSCF